MNGNGNGNADAKVTTIALPVLCTGEIKMSYIGQYLMGLTVSFECFNCELFL